MHEVDRLVDQHGHGAGHRVGTGRSTDQLVDPALVGVGVGRATVRRIGVDAPAGLTAEPTLGDEVALELHRRIPGVLTGPFPDARADSEVHVLPDEVGQLERPHPEAGGAQARVDRGGVGEALLEHPLPLPVEGAGDAVDA